MSVLASGFDGVLHFAALALVGESVEHPERYYRTNVAGTLNLLEAMVAHKVPRLVFSSTCAVYGQPDEVPIAETAPPRPQNAYGASKLAADHVIGDFCVAYGIGAVSLRYFNVAGAHGEARRGPRARDAPDPEHPQGRRSASATPSRSSAPTTRPPTAPPCATTSTSTTSRTRTCWRSSNARPGEHRIFNLGNGNGFSVREVIAAVEQVTGHAIPAVESPRRPGDPPKLVAAGQKIRDELGWEPRSPSSTDDDRRRLGLRPGASRTATAAADRSTGQQVGQRRHRLRHDLLRRQRGVEHADALWLGRGQLAVGVADPREEVVALAFQPVGRFAPAVRARSRGCRIERQQQRPIRRQPAGGEQVELAHRLDPEPATRALVGERGVDEAVEQHPLAARERGLERLVDQLGAGGGVEQRLGAGADRQRRVLDQRAHGLGGLHAARLAQQPRPRRQRARSAFCRPAASVVLPAPSTPSIVISRPRSLIRGT